MASLLALAGAIARVLAFVAAGVLLRRFAVLRRDDAGILHRVIIYVALPALIFTSVVSAPLSSELLRAAGVAWAVSLTGLATAWELAHALRLPPKVTGGFVLVAALGNTGYLGYPIVQAVLGDRWLAPAVFYDVFGTVAVLFTIGIAVAARHGEHKGRVNVIKEFLTFPAMIAVLVALAYRFVPWSGVVSTTVMDWTGVASKMAMPLIMISLGVSLDFSVLRGSAKALGAVAGIKLLVLPALAVGIAIMSRNRVDIRMLALQAGMPSVMLSLVVGERFKLDTGFIAAAILVTMIGSLVTVPLAQLLLS